MRGYSGPDILELIKANNNLAEVFESEREIFSLQLLIFISEEEPRVCESRFF
jgi:hypothetical protein